VIASPAQRARGARAGVHSQTRTRVRAAPLCLRVVVEAHKLEKTRVSHHAVYTEAILLMYCVFGSADTFAMRKNSSLFPAKRSAFLLSLSFASSSINNKLNE
jgi:hypothetical protein